MQFKRRQIDPDRLPRVIRHKWLNRTLEEGVTPLSKMALRSLNRLFRGPAAIEQLQMMMSIIDYRNPVNPFPPTWEFLEFISGLSVRTCKARVQELEALGYLKSYEERERVDFEIDGFVAAVERAAELADSGHPVQDGPTHTSDGTSFDAG